MRRQLAGAARAQQTERVRRVAFLHGLPEGDPEARARVTAFRQELETLGWKEGRNIEIAHRFSGADVARIQAYVTELVSAAPDLIVASSTPVITALKQATSTIPIIFALLNDPVGQGIVASLARPGGNITGFTYIDFPLIGKWLELLKEIAPHVTRTALMFNPQTAPYLCSATVSSDRRTFGLRKTFDETKRRPPRLSRVEPFGPLRQCRRPAWSKAAVVNVPATQSAVPWLLPCLLDQL